MRKRSQIKKRACALCKPWKMGKQKRWKEKELEQIVRVEREARNYG